MDYSTAKCYSRDQDLYPCPQGYICRTLTNWANSPSPFLSVHKQLYSGTNYPSVKVKIWGINGSVVRRIFCGARVGERPYREFPLPEVQFHCYSQFWKKYRPRTKFGHKLLLSVHGIQSSCLLGCYVLVTSKIISGWVPMCDRARVWQL